MRFTLAACAGALVLAATAAAATAPTETKWIDRKDGFSIILPAKWYPVPRTTTAVKRTIAQYKKQKKTALAKAYGFYLTANGMSELKAYVFQSFYFNGPSNDPVPLDVSIQIPPNKVKPSDLTAIGGAYANELSSTKGARITVPKRLRLPAGAAEHIVGTVPNGGGVRTGLELYIFVHKQHAYVLAFKINAQLLPQAKVFRSIAEHFAFV